MGAVSNIKLKIKIWKWKCIVKLTANKNLPITIDKKFAKNSNMNAIKSINGFSIYYI